MKGPKVRCCICDHEWNALNPGVLYRSLDGRWWCKNEQRCRERHVRLLAAMQRGLDMAWQILDSAVN